MGIVDGMKSGLEKAVDALDDALMVSEGEKESSISFEAEDLALPEVVTEETKATSDAAEQAAAKERAEKPGIEFDNVAIPEVHLGQ